MRALQSRQPRHMNSFVRDNLTSLIKAVRYNY